MITIAGNENNLAVIASVIVSILWGFTNTLISRGSKILHNRLNEKRLEFKTLRIKTRSSRKAAEEIRFLDKLISIWPSYLIILIKTWEYWIPLVINLGGSAIFYWSISNNSLLKTAPLTNTLTTIVTFLVGLLLFNEKIQSKKQIFGIGLLTMGSFLIMSS